MMDGMVRYSTVWYGTVRYGMVCLSVASGSMRPPDQKIVETLDHAACSAIQFNSIQFNSSIQTKKDPFLCSKHKYKYKYIIVAPWMPSIRPKPHGVSDTHRLQVFNIIAFSNLLGL